MSKKDQNTHKNRKNSHEKPKAKKVRQQQQQQQQQQLQQQQQQQQQQQTRTEKKIDKNDNKVQQPVTEVEPDIKVDETKIDTLEQQQSVTESAVIETKSEIVNRNKPKKGDESPLNCSQEIVYIKPVNNQSRGSPVTSKKKDLLDSKEKIDKKPNEHFWVGLILVATLVVLSLIIVFALDSPTQRLSIREKTADIFDHHFLEGDKLFISSSELSNQVTKLFSSISDRKALSLLTIGPQTQALKEAFEEFGKELCASDVVYLEGGDPNFPTKLYEKAKKSSEKENHKCPFFIVNSKGMSSENFAILEQAFDDSQPSVRSPDMTGDDVHSRKMIFILLHESPHRETKESIREKLSIKWSGRFFQRIGGIVGVESEKIKNHDQI